MCFLALLGAVVAVREEGLQVVPVPEQRRVPPVRGDVVNVFSGRTAHDTGQVEAQELGPQGFPLARIAALAAVRAAGVVAAASGADGVALASSDRPGGHDHPTGAQA